MRTTALAVLISLLCVPAVQAKSDYLTNAIAQYPAIAGTKLDSCTLCHTTVPARNSYGTAFGNARDSFYAIEDQDSDGDGVSNFVEINALTFPGDATDTPVANASASATLEPQAARDTGAEWKLNTSSQYYASGATISGLFPGTYTIQFKPITGWNTPADQQVSLVNGQTIQVTGTYTQQFVTVPDIVGLSESNARAYLGRSALAVGTVTEQTSATVPVGYVISQDPIADTQVAYNSVVDFVLSTGPLAVAVPDVVGKLQSEAGPTLIGAGLSVGDIALQLSDTVPASHVISQDPVAGTEVDPDTAVNLTISLGDTLVILPDYTGTSPSDAEGQITGLGLTVGTITYQPTPNIRSPYVTSQSPTPGTEVGFGDAIDLVIAAPSNFLVSVPDVVGMAQTNAESAITGQNLTVGTVTQQSSDTVATGDVISQDPVAGTNVTLNTAVDLVVSTGSAPTPTLSVAPGARSVSATDTTTSFSVENTGGGTLTWTAQVISGGDWLSIQSGAAGTDTGAVALSFDQNSLSVSRTATIRVTASGASSSPQDVTITQAAPAQTGTLTILSPVDDSLLYVNPNASSVPLVVRVESSQTLDSVSFTLDGSALGASNEAPYTLITSLPPASLTASVHEVVATGQLSGGGEVMGTSSFSVVQIQSQDDSNANGLPDNPFALLAKEGDLWISDVSPGTGLQRRAAALRIEAATKALPEDDLTLVLPSISDTNRVTTVAVNHELVQNNETGLLIVEVSDQLGALSGANAGDGFLPEPADSVLAEGGQYVQLALIVSADDGTTFSDVPSSRLQPNPVVVRMQGLANPDVNGAAFQVHPSMVQSDASSGLYFASVTGAWGAVPVTDSETTSNAIQADLVSLGVVAPYETISTGTSGCAGGVAEPMGINLLGDISVLALVILAVLALPRPARRSQ